MRRDKAFTAIVRDHDFTIGCAKQGLPGYTPTEESYSSYAAATDRADDLNAVLGITPREAAIIIASTMQLRTT